MAVNSIGDLALSHIFRSRNAEVKADINRLAQEVATGQVASVAEAVHGNFNTLSAINHSLSQLDAFERSIAETEGFANAVQNALESVRQPAEALSFDLLGSNISGSTAISTLQHTSRAAFDAAVSQLNTSFGGRSLFSGAATDSAALAESETILQALETAVAAETTAAGIKSVVDAWFSAGSDFDSVAYVGSPTKLAPMSAGRDSQVSLDVTAADTAVRDVLRGLALSALIGRPPLSAAPAEQVSMAQLAGETLLQANETMLHTQAEVGAVQERLDTSRATNASERSSMETALSGILSVDPFDRATHLQQAETQLELLYALTARTAALRLSDYL